MHTLCEGDPGGSSMEPEAQTPLGSPGWWDGPATHLLVGWPRQSEEAQVSDCLPTTAPLSMVSTQQALGSLWAQCRAEQRRHISTVSRSRCI